MKKLIFTFAFIMLFSGAAYSSPVDDVLNIAFDVPNTVESVRFNDIDDVAWAQESINYFAKLGILSGDGNGNFMPHKNITRGEYVKILVSAFGLYDETAVCNFTDTSIGEWHYSYIATAKKLEITKGISEQYFGTNDYIQRQEAIAMAYNAAKNSGIAFNNVQSSSFSDDSAIADYAKAPINAFAQKKIVSGDLYNNINPSAYANRAEICKILYLLIKNT